MGGPAGVVVHGDLVIEIDHVEGAVGPLLDGVRAVLVTPMIAGVSNFQALRREFADMALLAHPALAGNQIAPEALLGTLLASDSTGGVRRIGSTRASVALLTEPVVAVVVAALVLGQALTPAQLAGGALVIGATWLVVGETSAEPAG